MPELKPRSYTVLGEIQTYKNGKLHVYKRGEVLSVEEATSFQNFGLMVGYMLKPNY